MGEGGAVLVLEDYDHAVKRGANIYCEITSVGYSTDAHHITAPDPEGWGAKQCMKIAMDKADIKPEDVDYINAHGTSTPLNDRVEAAAIATVFGERIGEIAVNSTKSMIGHLLGAAGAAEAAAVALQIKHETLHPSVNFSEGEDGFSLNLVTETKPKKIRHALSNSFGFGGHNCCLSFGKVD